MNLDTPLTNAELVRLQDLLDTYSDDDGIVTITHLDGYLTAMVVAPEAVMPSQWFPATWGSNDQEWPDEATAEEAISLIARMMNGIAVRLLDPEEYGPLLPDGEDLLDGVTIWCEGFVRGMEVASLQWSCIAEETSELLGPIVLLGTDEGGDLIDELDAEDGRDAEDDTNERAIASLIPEVVLHLADLRDATPPPQPERAEPKVGRNDPCPCGSGRKYKKCCMP